MTERLELLASASDALALVFERIQRLGRHRMEACGQSQTTEQKKRNAHERNIMYKSLRVIPNCKTFSLIRRSRLHPRNVDVQPGQQAQNIDLDFKAAATVDLVNFMAQTMAVVAKGALAALYTANNFHLRIVLNNVDIGISKRHDHLEVVFQPQIHKNERMCRSPHIEWNLKWFILELDELLKCKLQRRLVFVILQY